jgi:hypothetical protein
MPERPFHDRREAGRALADQLGRYGVTRCRGPRAPTPASRWWMRSPPPTVLRPAHARPVLRVGPLKACPPALDMS